MIRFVECFTYMPATTQMLLAQQPACLAQSVEHSAVNRSVGGPSPSTGASIQRQKAVANKKSEIYANLVLFLSKTLHIPLNIEILCKNNVEQNYSNLELSFYIMQDSN